MTIRPTQVVPNDYTQWRQFKRHLQTFTYAVDVGYEFLIYNRGDSAYTHNNVADGWNGKVNGTDAEEGYYSLCNPVLYECRTGIYD